MFNTDLKFEGGVLVPIEDPLQGDGDFKQLLEAYGIGGLPFRLGYDEWEDSPITPSTQSQICIEVYGPAKQPSPTRYGWLCCLNFGDQYLNVWCRTNLELHDYLLYIAPLLGAASLVVIREHLDIAHRWLFSEGDGLFADHVSDRMAVERLRQKRLCRDKKTV